MPMLIAAVLCLGAAAVSAGVGLWLLTRPRAADTRAQLLRSIAPTQLAAAVMLAAGGVAALSTAPPTAMLVVIVGVAGAVGTVAAGCWQSAKALATRAEPQCTGSCTACTLTCVPAEGC